MNKSEREIYEYASRILNGEKLQEGESYPFTFSHTERCIEVPWIASKLNSYNVGSLLDIGFTFASHDYLRLLLDWKKKNNNILEGSDIIDPRKVETRYPIEWLDEIKRIPVYINDISDQSLNGKWDAVSLISTIEHIGFDKAAISAKKSAFERSATVEGVDRARSKDVEEKVLNNVSEMLNSKGYLFISVPAGKGGPVLIKDSMGLYACYWEYEKESWKKITNHECFECLEERFYVEVDNKWKEVEHIEDLKDVSAEMKNYAAGVAIAVLQKK